MATELETKLRTILNEKETKIIPENIKAGVQIFDIVGNYSNPGKLPVITLGNIITDVENEPVNVTITDNNNQELVHDKNSYYVSTSPVYCHVNQNGSYNFKKELNVLSDCSLNIHVFANPYLYDNYDSSNFNLSGTLTTSSHTSSGVIETKEGFKAFRSNGSGSNVLYTFANAIPAYEISFDFYKADAAAYPRMIGIGTSSTTYEIEIKGSSNAIYWGAELTSSWKQNSWNNCRIVKSSNSNNVSLYINGSLVTTRSYAGDLKNLYLGRGYTNSNYFNGWFKNLRIKNTSSTVTEPEFNLIDLGEDLNIIPSIEEQEIIIPSKVQKVKVEAVTSSIDSNIIPENIKSGINILGITGTYEEKMNVFAQVDEPETKDGVWIKTENIYYDKYAYTQLTDIPYDFCNGSAVVIGTDVYLFGSSSENYRKYAYKYDTLTSAYTKLTDIPYEFYLGSAVAIGTDVYLFGSWYGSYEQYTYKYNTLTDTYTKLTDIPYSFYYGSAVAIGTDVYLFGSRKSSIIRKYAYKYNTLTNTYTQLTDIPYEFYGGSTVAIETDVYLFGSSNSSYTKYAYKYNILTDSYIQLTSIPYEFYLGSTVAIDTDIYLFGSGASSNYYKYAYKYNILTNTYTQLTNIPYEFYRGSAVAIDTDVYLFGSYNSSYYKYAYKFETKRIAYPEISKYEYDEINIGNSMSEVFYTKFKDIPYEFSYGDAVAVGTNIYLFGSTYTYKYDTLTDSYTKLTDIPYNFSHGNALAVGTNIYLFGSNSNSGYRTYAYKYNILTDTYTSLTSIPYQFYDGSAVAIGTDVYLFGGNGNKKYVYKYDTLTNNYTQLTNIPYYFYFGSAISIGTDIYLFGSADSNYYKYAYKYDTLTDSYTKLTDIPYEFYMGSTVAIGTDIYLFGSSYSSSYHTYAYKYDTLTGTYTKLIDTPYSSINGSTVAIDIDIYLFGSSRSDCTKNAYKCDIQDYLKKKIYILNGTLKVILNKILQSSVSTAFIYKDYKIQEYPCYYGDGIKWNLIGG